MKSNNNYFNQVFKDEIIGDVACCNIEGCTFKNTKQATFDRCNIKECVFETEASFIKCNLTDCTVVEGSVFAYSNVNYSEDEDKEADEEPTEVEG